MAWDVLVNATETQSQLGLPQLRLVLNKTLYRYILRSKARKKQQGVNPAA